MGAAPLPDTLVVSARELRRVGVHPTALMPAPKPKATKTVAPPIDAREHFEARDRAAWRAWLAERHATSTGVWVITYKKTSGRPTLTYDELVEEALCFGWVDSRPGTVDALRTKLYVAPRKRGSGWAATNKARIARLLAEGRMAPAGMAVLDAAKADGSWTLLDTSEAAEAPADLHAALARYPGAAANFEAFPLGVRKAILQWIALAKSDATRAKRVDETASLAAKNIRANQWRPKA